MRTATEIREASALLTFLQRSSVERRFASEIGVLIDALEWCQGGRSDVFGQLLESAARVQEMSVKKVEARVCG